jgi:hypothetical protein
VKQWAVAQSFLFRYIGSVLIRYDKTCKHENCHEGRDLHSQVTRDRRCVMKAHTGRTSVSSEAGYERTTWPITSAGFHMKIRQGRRA